MKIKVAICLLGLLISYKSTSQQDALYVNYLQNPLALNPAYAGSNGIASVSIMVRKQSLVLQSSGSSQYLSYNTPLSNGKFGLGLQAFNSSFGQTGNLGGTGFNMSGSYRHHFTDSISVSFGVQGGFVQIPGYLTGAYDFKPVAGLGAYFRTFDSYFGIGTPVITKPYYNISKSTKYYFIRPTFITLGHVFPINESLDLKFGVVYRHFDQNMGDALDLNAILWIKRYLGLGLSKNKTGSEINPTNAFIISADAQINQKFRLGFSMDAAAKSKYGTVNPRTGRSSSLSLYNITLRYDFDNLTGKIDRFRFF